jgi:hypothetical protein
MKALLLIRDVIRNTFSQIKFKELNKKTTNFIFILQA